MERNQDNELEKRTNIVETPMANEVKPNVLDYAQGKPRKYSRLKLITIITAAALAIAFASYEANKLIKNYLADNYRGIVCP